MRWEDRGTTLYPICFVNHGWDDKEDGDNSEFIVRAVNAHDELVEACKRLQVRVFMHEGCSEEYRLAAEAIARANRTG